MTPPRSDCSVAFGIGLTTDEPGSVQRLLLVVDDIDVDSATDISAVAGLLHETAQHHDPYEKSHAPHNWWDWYAAYFLARQQGRTPDEASRDAGRYMDETFHVAAL